MKKIIAICSFLLWAICMWAQGNRVDFQYNDVGNIIRPDSDKRYYVIEYGYHMDAFELLDLFSTKLKEASQVPSYFNLLLDNASFDQNTGVIKGITPWKYVDSERLVSAEYSYRLQFKDGRVRINAPNIRMRTESGGIVFMWDESTPSEWWTKDHNGKKLNASKREKRKAYVTEISNAVINNLLEFMEAPEPTWVNPHVLKGPGENEFFFGNSFCFEYPDSSEFMVFKIDDVSKEQLIDYLVTYYNKREGVTPNQFNDGVEIEGVETIRTHSIIGNSLIPHDYRYKAYFACEDNLIKVYLPKILWVVSKYMTKI